MMLRTRLMVWMGASTTAGSSVFSTPGTIVLMSVVEDMAAAAGEVEEAGIGAGAAAGIGGTEAGAEAATGGTDPGARAVEEGVGTEAGATAGTIGAAATARTDPNLVTRRRRRWLGRRRRRSLCKGNFVTNNINQSNQ